MEGRPTPPGGRRRLSDAETERLMLDTAVEEVNEPEFQALTA